MSQSDRIQFKRLSTLLKENALNTTLTQKEYAQYLQYNLETSVTSDKLRTSRLLPSEKQTVFDMELNVSGCAQFPACTNTTSRSNKRLHAIQVAKPIDYIRLNNGKIRTNAHKTKTFVYPTTDCVEPNCHIPKSKTLYDAMTFRM